MHLLNLLALALRSVPPRWGLIGALLAAPFLTAAVEGERKLFDLAADSAENSLKAFSEQSGRGVIFVTDVVKRVRTNVVSGNLTPREALATMLRGTSLVGSHDPRTGAFAVRRETPEEAKNGDRAAPALTGDRPMIPNRPILQHLLRTP